MMNVSAGRDVAEPDVNFCCPEIETSGDGAAVMHNSLSFGYNGMPSVVQACVNQAAQLERFYPVDSHWYFKQPVRRSFVRPISAVDSPAADCLG
jgi:hypothetical protein